MIITHRNLHRNSSMNFRKKESRSILLEKVFWQILIRSFIFALIIWLCASAELIMLCKDKIEYAGIIRIMFFFSLIGYPASVMIETLSSRNDFATLEELKSNRFKKDKLIPRLGILLVLLTFILRKLL